MGRDYHKAYRIRFDAERSLYTVDGRRGRPMPFVEVDRHTYRRISEFAETTGTDVRRVVCDALGEWMDDTGDTMLDFLAPHIEAERQRAEAKAPKPKQTKVKVKAVVLPFPAPPAASTDYAASSQYRHGER
jgi:hypothetical protein